MSANFLLNKATQFVADATSTLDQAQSLVTAYQEGDGLAVMTAYFNRDDVKAGSPDKTPEQRIAEFTGVINTAAALINLRDAQHHGTNLSKLRG